MIPALITLVQMIGLLLLALAIIGSIYLIVAARTFCTFMSSRASAHPSDQAITLLKPLHGGEPQLRQNLESFLVAEHAGPLQMICGVARADDPAVAVVNALRDRHPDADIELVIDATLHGSNRKVSNLINMAARIKHPLLVLSDSDIAVPRDYLMRIGSAIEATDVGGVTCLYHGRGDRGFWSRMTAAMVSWQFLPGVVFGYARGLAQPCMGSTIAIRRELLDEAGGFARLNDILADDYALGEMVHAAGLNIAVPPMLVTHAGMESGLRETWRHELRWSATVRGIAPAGHAGAVIAMPFPIALLALLLGAPPLAAVCVAIVALAARYYLATQIDRWAGDQPASYALIPFRELLSFAVFVATYFTRTVDWRGAQLDLKSDGQIQSAKEITR